MMNELIALLDRTLGLDGRGKNFNASTPLMGSLPELDSIGVVALITAMEEQFGFTVDDAEIDGDVFQSVGTLKAFVAGKLAGD